MSNTLSIMFPIVIDQCGIRCVKPIKELKCSLDTKRTILHSNFEQLKNSDQFLILAKEKPKGNQHFVATFCQNCLSANIPDTASKHFMKISMFRSQVASLR